MKTLKPLVIAAVLTLVASPTLAQDVVVGRNGAEKTEGSAGNSEDLQQELQELISRESSAKEQLERFIQEQRAIQIEKRSVLAEKIALESKIESGEIEKEDESVSRQFETFLRQLDQWERQEQDVTQSVDDLQRVILSLVNQRADLNRVAIQQAEQEALREVEAVGQPAGSRAELELSIRQAELSKREAELAGLRRQISYSERLVENGYSSAQELAELKTQLDIARASVEQARAQLAINKLDLERGEFDRRNEAASTESAMQTEFFRGYLDAIQRYTEISSDPKNAGVAAVVTAADMLRDQPPQATVDFFAPMVDKGQFADESVRRAVHLQLAEAYRAQGEPAKALEILKTLIVGSKSPLDVPQ